MFWRLPYWELGKLKILDKKMLTKGKKKQKQKKKQQQNLLAVLFSVILIQNIRIQNVGLICTTY